MRTRIPGAPRADFADYVLLINEAVRDRDSTDIYLGDGETPGGIRYVCADDEAQRAAQALREKLAAISSDA